MLFLELSGILLGFYFIFLSAREKSNPQYFISRAFLISAASWIAEESCILLYRFYDYDPGWRLYLDRVPLLVVCIWPVIILSAMELTSHLRATSSSKALLAGAAVVGADALFIEPLAANAGLWHWKLPGIFSVPPIGIMGWFFFALLCMRLLGDTRSGGRLCSFDMLLLVIPVVGTHLLLLLFWWGLLRWVPASFGPPSSAAFVWCLSLLLVVVFYKKRTGASIKKRTLLLRVPAALFFFLLLLWSPDRSIALTVYAVAFVPPYVTLLIQQYRHRRS